ncbi:MAG: hypothetical protein Q7O66_12975 [Dehalococcoidia bacterium]|nr:hypothetical protein [Dehalococcoidia bacterium]
MAGSSMAWTPLASHPIITRTFAYSPTGSMTLMATNYFTNSYTYSTTKSHIVWTIAGVQNNTYSNVTSEPVRSFDGRTSPAASPSVEGSP